MRMRGDQESCPPTEVYYFLSWTGRVKGVRGTILCVGKDKETPLEFIGPECEPNFASDWLYDLQR